MIDRELVYTDPDTYWKAHEQAKKMLALQREMNGVTKAGAARGLAQTVVWAAEDAGVDPATLLADAQAVHAKMLAERKGPRLAVVPPSEGEA